MPTLAEFLALLIADLTRWEGKFRHLYLDTKGLPTIGIGNLVATAEAAVALPFVVMPDGRAAVEEEKRQSWKVVKAMPGSMRARAYESASNLRLTEKAVDALVVERLTGEFLPGLRDLYPKFDTFPMQAKQSFVDLAYNCGLGGLAKFSQLRNAALLQDWVSASKRCHRSSSREDRNVWCASMFMYAASQPQFVA
jgi:GH24 family phage-related lysozyme (muramidase)